MTEAGVFSKVPSELNFPKEEQEILAFWKERKIFEKSLEKESPKGPFVFYEGPPTANGLPHNGSVLTRVIKDLFPRYRTMRGYRVDRKAGWDTHGLPVEVEVEKELRIHGKAAIEAYGVEPFVKKCIDSVFRYTDEWAKLTDRVAFWVDLPSAYVTFHKSYVESVWWALSELFKKGLLYQGHKVVWWWAQGGTALSSGEVGLGYKTVDDPSVYVSFPIKGEKDVSFLVWTTTPWTLSSNMYAAVNPKFDYVEVTGSKLKSGSVIIAAGLKDALAKKFGCELEVKRTFKGTDLIGKEYSPPFDLFASQGGGAHKLWRVIAADFVTLDAGTGIVHIAPAFGEDDFMAHRKEAGANLDTAPLLCAVQPDGTFIPEFTKYAGRWVKDCDKEIQAELKEKGLLVFAEQYRHDYPFCWRADNDPLIQFARPAWYIKTTQVKDKAIANNQKVEWFPDHIKDGRFGDFLANNVDWALSRERYWGTPLNIWINDKSGKMEAPSSVDEILKKNPNAFDHFHAAKKADPSLSDHLIVHKPWIDNVTWQNPGEEGTYRRVPEVIDCWFDSGCMPFAQWGFPHQGHDEFKRSFPADFISEGIDQTRGWFYSLLMISTLLFDEECQKRLGLAPARPFPHPYKTCIVLGHVSDKEGKKESKSKGNYTPPDIILDAVKMEFAVLGAADIAKGPAEKAGTLFVAKEDLEGMDLEDGKKVRVYRADKPETAIEMTIASAKGMQRRVAVIHEADRAKLNAKRTATPDVKAVEVPRLPSDERIVVEDVSTPAPGADAFRWFFYASNPPWSATRHSLTNVRTLQKETLIKLRNVYSFFTIYANIDSFDPTVVKTEAKNRNEIDRWILSELSTLTSDCTELMDRYDVFAATSKLADFVDALSNWYVRRSRERFWRAGWDDDKRAAFETLYECLAALSLLMAPFTPYLAESMHQNLTVGPAKKKGAAALESVHLASYPTANAAHVDPTLSKKMNAVRSLVSLGLQVRTQAKQKVRQPLRVANIIVSDSSLKESLRAAESMIREELNVLGVHFVPDSEAETFVEYKLKPNFRTLGQRGLGKEAQELKKSMGQMNGAEAAKLMGDLLSSGSVALNGVTLTRDDVEVTFGTKEGFAAAGDRVGVVVLDTRLDDELIDLGLLRELQNRLQAARKEMSLDYADRISVRIEAGERLTRVAQEHKAELSSSVLASDISFGRVEKDPRRVEIEGEEISLGVSRA